MSSAQARRAEWQWQWHGGEQDRSASICRHSSLEAEFSFLHTLRVFCLYHILDQQLSHFIFSSRTFLPCRLMGNFSVQSRSSWSCSDARGGGGISSLTVSSPPSIAEVSQPPPPLPDQAMFLLLNDGCDLAPGPQPSVLSGPSHAISSVSCCPLQPLLPCPK